MNSWGLHPIKILGVTTAIILTILFLFRFSGNPTNVLNEAYQSYVAGENGKTIAERQLAFNRALALYTSLESEYYPKSGNGKLYYNIANSYFQVGEVPLAVLNYYRALLLMPKDEKTKYNLDLALTKLGVVSKARVSPFAPLFFFHNDFSLAQRFQLSTLFGLLGLALSSLYIWWRKRGLVSAFSICYLISLIFFLSCCYTRYISPLGAVIIHPTPMYREAGETKQKVDISPLIPGLKVEVQGAEQNGKWLKVQTPEGKVGFISSTNMRLIKV